jgi:hypothetical protein
MKANAIAYLEDYKIHSKNELLELAYVGVNLHEHDEKVCCLCWGVDCDCNFDIKTDPFLNLTEDDKNYLNFINK